MELFLSLPSSLLTLSKPIRIQSICGHLLQVIRTCLALFFLLLYSFLPSAVPPLSLRRRPDAAIRKDRSSGIFGDGEPAVSRALSQVLSIVADIPVSSRKYQAIRALAEKLMNDNIREADGGGSEINRRALSSAFKLSLSRLERAMWWRVEEPIGVAWVVRWPAKWFARVLASWEEGGFGLESSSVSPEKVAAELLWMAGKMVECGAGEEAVRMWGSATALASMAIAAEPSIQISLVKVSVSLFKQVKGCVDAEEVKLKLLSSWLPLLCHASHGTDVPLLSISEKADMECVLEKMIEQLGNCDQGEVLALWLYHFTSCPNSDWPNLQHCYARWYAASRQLFLLRPPQLK